MNKQEAFQIVFDYLKQFPLFCGVYDAKNGSEEFMYGISTVMEVISYEANDENFPQIFTKNMIESEERVNAMEDCRHNA